VQKLLEKSSSFCFARPLKEQFKFAGLLNSSPQTHRIYCPLEPDLVLRFETAKLQALTE